ncbi:MAG: hypothetical protein JSR45_03780 [Proteobacteria bacterium]|nr:hypothetical protein [Pseudomonadota bacterium]
MTFDNDPQADATKARNRRSLAIAGALVLFVVLVFVITVVRLGGSKPSAYVAPRTGLNSPASQSAHP